jgi:hypothetical protein
MDVVKVAILKISQVQVPPSPPSVTEAIYGGQRHLISFFITGFLF